MAEEKNTELTAVQELLKAADVLTQMAAASAPAQTEEQLAKAKEKETEEEKKKAEAKKKKEAEEKEEEEEENLKSVEAINIEEFLAKAMDENGIMKANEAFGALFDLLKGVIADISARGVENTAKIDTLMGIVKQNGVVSSALAKAVAEGLTVPAKPGSPGLSKVVGAAMLAKGGEEIAVNPEKSQFMKAISDKVISVNDYTRHKLLVKNGSESNLSKEVLTKIAAL